MPEESLYEQVQQSYQATNSEGCQVVLFLSSELLAGRLMDLIKADLKQHKLDNPNEKLDPNKMEFRVAGNTLGIKAPDDMSLKELVQFLAAKSVKLIEAAVEKIKEILFKLNPVFKGEEQKAAAVADLFLKK